MKQRQSNIELLRILAMLFVLVVHLNYASLGWPDWNAVNAEPFLWFGRIFTEQVAIVCVDVFVLISGWFGIRPTLRGGVKFLFQVFFAASVVLAAVAVCCPERLAEASLRDVFYGQWFVRAYLALFVLSPVLNRFVESCTRRQLEGVLLAFYSLQTLDLLFRFSITYRDGYSVVSFVGLYLLARYVRLYRADALLRRPRLLLMVWGGCLLLPVMLQICCALNFSPREFRFFSGISIAYSNPLVVVQSLDMLLLFARLDFRSRVVNWLASGSFAVYLLHTNPLVYPDFCSLCKQLHTSAPLPQALLLDALFLVAVFLASVLIDRLRLLAWSVLERLAHRPGGA